MLGMKGMAIAGGMGVIACLVLAFLWKSEQADHEYTKRLLDAETRRANVATEAAADNAAKAAQLATNFAVAQEQARQLNTSYARLEKERDQAISDLTSYRGRISNAILKKPGLLGRLADRATDRLVRDIQAATCRTDCDHADHREEDQPAEAARRN